MLTRHHRTAALAAASILVPALLAGSAAAADGDPEGPDGATCRTAVEGSRVTAYCHNPHPRTDHVRLHVECVRWWDLDADSASVAVPPTAYVEVTERCWKEVRSAWISHATVPDRGPGT
ncbi:hypothetical protein [Streptomyces changanensis]|uniref:Secreted protein n=1 Tax=Streptomyces kanasensis TaxID=936756 RepID=A0A100Y3U2_9ACTN|nr:hypothetical protein ATE80_19655 [Streptomyces kanasensis]